MEIHQLRAFVIIAEEHNVTCAAARLHIAQPAVTRKIHKLEAELGCELFKRGHNRMVLTERGKMLESMARAALAWVDGILATTRPPEA